MKNLVKNHPVWQIPRNLRTPTRIAKAFLSTVHYQKCRCGKSATLSTGNSHIFVYCLCAVYNLIVCVYIIILYVHTCIFQCSCRINANLLSTWLNLTQSASTQSNPALSFWNEQCSTMSASKPPNYGGLQICWITIRRATSSTRSRRV